jgi:hypothetical protein
VKLCHIGTVNLGHPVKLSLKLALQALQVYLTLPEQIGSQTLRLSKQGHQQVFGFDLAVAILLGQLLGRVKGLL